jgi:hypothetical protein
MTSGVSNSWPSFLAEIFKAILLIYQFCTTMKHFRVISILKPGKNPLIPSSYLPVYLLDTNGKIFENNLLGRILHEVSGRGMLREEQLNLTER